MSVHALQKSVHFALQRVTLWRSKMDPPLDMENVFTSIEYLECDDPFALVHVMQEWVSIIVLKRYAAFVTHQQNLRKSGASLVKEGYMFSMFERFACEVEAGDDTRYDHDAQRLYVSHADLEAVSTACDQLTAACTRAKTISIAPASSSAESGGGEGASSRREVPEADEPTEEGQGEAKGKSKTRKGASSKRSSKTGARKRAGKGKAKTGDTDGGTTSSATLSRGDAGDAEQACYMQVLGGMVPEWGSEHVVSVVMRVLVLSVLNRMEARGAAPNFDKRVVTTRRGQICAVLQFIERHMMPQVDDDSCLPTSVRDALKSICTRCACRGTRLFISLASA